MKEGGGINYFTSTERCIIHCIYIYCARKTGFEKGIGWGLVEKSIPLCLDIRPLQVSDETYLFWYTLQNICKITNVVTFAILGYLPDRLNPSIVARGNVNLCMFYHYLKK